MKLRRETDGKTFVFHYNNIGRGLWVVELVEVDGDPTFTYSDPFPTEREARAYSRNTINNWHYDPRYGWCQ